MKILLPGPYPSGKAPSQRFRFEQYLDKLEIEFEQVGFWRDSEWPGIYKTGSIKYKVISTLRGFLRRFFLLFSVGRYDKVFIHREATPIGPPWFEWAVAKLWRKPIIFDFDDAIWLPNSSEANKKIAGKLKFHGKTAKICSWATTVVVGNEFLAEYARQYCDDVRIIPTTVDTESYHNPDLYVRVGSRWMKRKDMIPGDQKAIDEVPASGCKRQADYLVSSNLVTIGWTGTHSTLKQLTPLFPLLEEIYQEHPFRFLLIADVPPPEMPDFVEFREWKKETEIEDLLEIDIGIMPLYDTDWEKGKCGFKAIQYMALEIPSILSDVGENIRISGNSKYALLSDSLPLRDHQNWRRTLKYLIEQSNRNTEFGMQARRWIIENYSIFAIRERYVQLFE